LIQTGLWLLPSSHQQQLRASNRGAPRLFLAFGLEDPSKIKEVDLFEAAEVLHRKCFEHGVTSEPMKLFST